MKKILTLLSAVSLTATASASVVACGGGNDNGGGTVEPPTTQKYSLNEVFIDNNIKELQIDYNSSSDAWIKVLYNSMVTRIINNNYANSNSKIKDVVGKQDMSNSLKSLSTFYSSNKKNNNFNKLKDLETKITQDENKIEGFKFTMDINHADMIEANNNSAAAKKITEKMEEGSIIVSIETLIITKA